MRHCNVTSKWWVTPGKSKRTSLSFHIPTEFQTKQRCDRKKCRYTLLQLQSPRFSENLDTNLLLNPWPLNGALSSVPPHRWGQPPTCQLPKSGYLWCSLSLRNPQPFLSEVIFILLFGVSSSARSGISYFVFIYLIFNVFPLSKLSFSSSDGLGKWDCKIHLSIKKVWSSYTRGSFDVWYIYIPFSIVRVLIMWHGF